MAVVSVGLRDGAPLPALGPVMYRQREKVNFEMQVSYSLDMMIHSV